jgi:hypothetical protein
LSHFADKQAEHSGRPLLTYKGTAPGAGAGRILQAAVSSLFPRNSPQVPGIQVAPMLAGGHPCHLPLPRSRSSCFTDGHSSFGCWALFPPPEAQVEAPQVSALQVHLGLWDPVLGSDTHFRWDVVLGGSSQPWLLWVPCVCLSLGCQQGHWPLLSPSVLPAAPAMLLGEWVLIVVPEAVALWQGRAVRRLT